ncbi:hypothetical protein C8R42DRAFT_241427 [Lentinula raphanica]|nr:hypothetical protein C8R42DRAFT_241427 [Lentinula raphanica]
MDERRDDPDALDDLDTLTDFSSSHYSPSEFSPSTSLSPLRSHLRSFLLSIVSRESHTIARLQKRYRTPFWDRYFVYTSSLGTHTFFMILLPAMFFFGARDVGMGLVMVMGGGVYASSMVKDLVCSPRPLAPVTRLTIGTHHLEYGFPSTHSTNSVSIALFFWGYVHTLFSEDLGINIPFLSDDWHHTANVAHVVCCAHECPFEGLPISEEGNALRNSINDGFDNDKVERYTTTSSSPLRLSSLKLDRLAWSESPHNSLPRLHPLFGRREERKVSVPRTGQWHTIFKV